MKIPFNQSLVLENHINFLNEAIQSGKISSGGSFTEKCESSLNRINHSSNILVPSATAALEMMALLLDLKKGDEVIVPSYTFVSTASAFCLRGVKIQFADNDYFGNILPEEIERLINNKTRAVCVVHYGGNSPNMDDIVTLCKNKNIVLLEDAAQCINSSFNNKALGTFGDLGCYSFHDTKNLTSGEGGALIVNKEGYRHRAAVIRDKGTNRKAFLEGQVDKYSWVDLGSSYCLSELNSAYLYPQLSRMSEITQKRGDIWKTYKDQLGQDFEKNGVSIIEHPAYNQPNFHMFALLTKDKNQRQYLIKKLNEVEIQASFHYVPLHQSEFGKQFSDGKLPNCEDFSSRVLRLPLWYNMSGDHVEYVVESLKNILNGI